MAAIEAAGKANESAKWQKIYGKDYPDTVAKAEAAAERFGHRSSEQFVEDLWPVDIRYPLQIECEVTQNGFRETLLREFLRRRLPLRRQKKLRFFIESCGVPGDYTILWKVLNRGDEAFRRKCTRGTINKGGEDITETTDFNGEHIVECYIVKDGVVVAKDRIHVPIE